MAFLLGMLLISGPALAQTCPSSPALSPVSSSTAPLLAANGGIQDLRLAAVPYGSTPSVWVARPVGVSRGGLSNPSSPNFSDFELGLSRGGPVSDTCDCGNFIGLVAGGEDASGNGRGSVDWQITNMPQIDYDNQVVTVTSGRIAYGQQINAVNGGAGSIGTSSPIAVVPLGSGRFVGYYAPSGGSVVAVDLSTTTGFSTSSPLTGSSAIGWTSVSGLKIGVSPSAQYLIGTTSGTVHVASIGSTGGLTDVASIGVTSTSGLDAVWNSTKSTLWIVTGSTAGISLVEFNPSNNSIRLAATLSGSYREAHIAGSSSPVLFARDSTPNQLIYLFSTANVPSSGSVALCPSANVAGISGSSSQPGAWAAWISPGASTTAYLYRVESTAAIHTDTLDVTNLTVPQTVPPVPHVAATNVSAHMGSDNNNYIGDTFQIQDASQSSSTITARTWAFNYTNPFNADLPAESNQASFYATLPCAPTSAASTGSSTANANCSFIPPNTPLTQTIAVEPTNQFGTASSSAVDAGRLTVTLKQPQTLLNSAAMGPCSPGSGFSGNCYSILQGPSTVIDATPSQGSPISFQWFIDGSTSPDSYTGAQFPFGSQGLPNGTTFSVQTLYKGTYSAGAVSGTVVVAPAIPKFVVTSPSCPNPALTCTILQNSSYSIQNLTQTNFPTAIAAIGYILDTNSANPSVDAIPTPTSGFVPTSGAPHPILGLTAPASDGQTHYLHFRVDYSGFPSSYFPGIPLVFSAVTYQPSISISGATFFNIWSANTGQALSFSDAGDSGQPGVPASWDFGDGGKDTSHTSSQSVAHTYSTANTYPVKLTLTTAGTPTATTSISISKTSSSCNFTVNITGPSTIQAGTQGAWSVSVSGASGTPLFAWVSSESSGVPPTNGSSYHWTFETPGLASVTVTASLSGCTPVSRTFNVTVTSPANCNFTLNITGPTTIQAGTQGAWSVSASSGSPSFSWVSSESSGIPPTNGSSYHWTFETPGPASVTVTATLNGCSTPVSKPFNVTVTPGSPSAEFTVQLAPSGSSPQVLLAPQASSLSINVGGATFFNIWSADTGQSLSFTVSGGSAGQTANWDFGDLTTASASDSVAVPHTYTTAKTYTVKVSIGSASGSAVLLISGGTPPPNNGPSISVTGSSSLTVGQTGTWNATVTSAQGTPTIAWTSSADGATGSGTTFTNSYSSAGIYHVSARVTASNGTATSNSFRVAVTNPGGADFTFAAGKTLLFTASDKSSDLTDSSFVWNFGDGTGLTGRSVKHTFADKGVASYTANPTLTATRTGVPPSVKTHSIALSGSPFQALAVPGAGHVDLQDPTTKQVYGSWETNLSLFNNTSNPVTLDFNYVDAYKVAGVNPATLVWDPAYRITLAPFAGSSFTDFTQRLSPSSSGVISSLGTLFVKYSGGVAPTAAAQVVFVWTDSNKPGTFGSALPVQQINASGPVLNGIADQIQTIVGLQYNANFRSNLTLVGASATAGKFNLDLIRDDGLPVGATRTLTLGQFQQSKVGLNSFLPAYDSENHIYIAKISPFDPNNPTPVFAFGTLIDQVTQDTMNLADDTPAESPSSFQTYYMPDVGRFGSGVGAWKTDLYVYNSSPNLTTLFLTYEYWDATLGIERQANGIITIPGSQATAVHDLITTTFPSATGDTVGALVISYQPDSNNSQVFFQGRNYMDNGALGTFGVQLPAFSDSEGVSLSSGQIELTGLQNDANHRAKFGFLVTGNPSQPVTVHVVAHDQITGIGTWTYDYVMSLSSLGHFVVQPTQGPADSFLGPLQNRAFSIVATVTSGPSNVSVIGFGLQIDNLSNDPTFLPYRRPPAQ